jgi:hypothetical protein
LFVSTFDTTLQFKWQNSQVKGNLLILYLTTFSSCKVKQLNYLLRTFEASKLLKLRPKCSDKPKLFNQGVNFANILCEAFTNKSFTRNFFVLTFYVCTFFAQEPGVKFWWKWPLQGGNNFVLNSSKKKKSFF